MDAVAESRVLEDLRRRAAGEPSPEPEYPEYNEDSTQIHDAYESADEQYSDTGDSFDALYLRYHPHGNRSTVQDQEDEQLRQKYLSVCFQDVVRNFLISICRVNWSIPWTSAYPAMKKIIVYQSPSGNENRRKMLDL